MDEAVNRTDGRSRFFTIAGVGIVCHGVGDGISGYPNYVPICAVTYNTHLRPLSCGCVADGIISVPSPLRKPEPFHV